MTLRHSYMTVNVASSCYFRLSASEHRFGRLTRLFPGQPRNQKARQTTAQLVMQAPCLIIRHGKMGRPLNLVQKVQVIRHNPPLMETLRQSHQRLKVIVDPRQ